MSEEWEWPDIHPMRCFGYDSELERVETPVGESCSRCEELFQPDDKGMIIAHLGKTVESNPYHRACFLRSIIGSVGDDHSTSCRSSFGSF